MYNQKNSPQDHEEAITYIRTIVHQSIQKIVWYDNKIQPSFHLLESTIDTMRGIIHGFIMLSLAGGMERKYAHKLMMQALYSTLISLQNIELR